jgi:hypothetical protein
MFDSLADQIRHDEKEQSNSRDRTVRYILYAIIPVVVFGGLYLGLHFNGG